MVLDKDSNKECCCKRKCVRHGNCIACLEHHKRINKPPYCKKQPVKSKKEKE